MKRGIDGSTSAWSSNLFASRSLVKFMFVLAPPTLTATSWFVSKAVLVEPVSPVDAAASNAVMITSSIARPIAAAAARAYDEVGSINMRTLSWSSIRSAYS